MENCSHCVKAVEHELDLGTPWKVTNVTVKDYDTGSQEREYDRNEIRQLEEMHGDLEDLPALVCSLLIGGTIKLNNVN
jgi:hypothetical protein